MGPCHEFRRSATLCAMLLSSDDNCLIAGNVLVAQYEDSETNNKRRRKKTLPANLKAKKPKAEEAPTEYVVKRILAKRIRKGVTEYKAEWEGYNGETTWEPESNFQNNVMVREFEKELVRVHVISSGLT